MLDIISKDAYQDWGSLLKSSVTLDGDLVTIRTGYLRDTNQKEVSAGAIIFGDETKQVLTLCHIRPQNDTLYNKCK